MLKTLIEDEQGNSYVNSLRRSVLSGIVVPSLANSIIKIPVAAGSNSPGQSSPVPLEGPQDARSQLYTMTGVQGLARLGTGTISSLAGAVTGVGTLFLAELAVGDNIITNGQTQVVATITDNTHCTTVANFAPALGAGTAFAWQTPITADVQNRMTVKITDTAWRRQYMNQEVPVLHVFGTAGQPLRLRESVLLEKNQTLLFNFFNNSTSAPGSIGISSEARKWQEEAFKRNGVAAFVAGLRRRKLFCHPYWLTLDKKTTIGAGGTGTQFMTSWNDTILVLFNMYGHCITTGVAGDTQEIMAYEMFDQKTRRAYQTQPWTLNLGLGTAISPFVLPAPIIIDQQGVLEIKFTNLVTDQPTDVFVTLMGVAVTSNRDTGLMDPTIAEEARRIYKATVPTLTPASRAGF